MRWLGGGNGYRGQIVMYIRSTLIEISKILIFIKAGQVRLVDSLVLVNYYIIGKGV